MDTENTAVWSQDQLLMLLRTMKSKVPKNMRNRRWTCGMKALDWNEIAFSPFSPEECRLKWEQILQRICKIRTLPELISEAEIAKSHHLRNRKINPECPKRPTPVHVSFYKENFTKLRKEYPSAQTPKLLQLSSEKYKMLPKEEKQQREANFKRATEVYKKRLTEFKKCCKSKELKKVSMGEDDASDDQLQTDQEDTEDSILTCKPPVSGYRLFCRERPDLVVDVPKRKRPAVWKKHWGNLKETERNEYISRCREMRQEHGVKLNEFLEDLDVEEQEQILDRYNLKKPKLPEKPMSEFPGEPKKPPHGANIIFCSEQMKHLKEIKKAQHRFSVVNQMWRHLSEMEKTDYRNKLQEKVQQYSVELRRWFKTLSPAKQKRYRRKNPSRCCYLDGKYTPVADDEVASRSQPSVQTRRVNPRRRGDVIDNEEVSKCQPSDSEDEDIEDSSSEDDEVIVEDAEEEDDDDDDVAMFDMF